MQKYIAQNSPLVLNIDSHSGGGGEGVRSEKLCHLNAIKHENHGHPRLSDSPKYPPQKNLAQTSRTPLDFQLLCIYGLKKFFPHVV